MQPSSTDASGPWQCPPQPLALPPEEVHVWRASLDQPETYVQALYSLLNADERKRADRFHFAHDRRRFTVARGVLRALLATYLRREPHHLEFCYSSYGKPSLVDDQVDGRTFHFNLSHSQAIALYAVAWDRQVGVDVEHFRPDFAADQIAKRYFSPNETAVLRTLPPERRIEGFFTCWTRKEAYIKARGKGLSLELDQFDVSLAPGEPAAVLATRDDPQQASRWLMRHLEPGPGYVGALAVEGHSWQLCSWNWPDDEAKSGCTIPPHTNPER
jgi:4'-phosphopantetheinyl transferase